MIRKFSLEDMAKNRKDISLEIVTLDEDKLIGTISLDGFNMTDRSAVLGIFIGDTQVFYNHIKSCYLYNEIRGTKKNRTNGCIKKRQYGMIERQKHTKGKTDKCWEEHTFLLEQQRHLLFYSRRQSPCW